jgi:hypothetical protein
MDETPVRRLQRVDYSLRLSAAFAGAAVAGGAGQNRGCQRRARVDKITSFEIRLDRPILITTMLNFIEDAIEGIRLEYLRLSDKALMKGSTQRQTYSNKRWTTCSESTAALPFTV